MQAKTLHLLKKYWGYDAFRDKQSEIVNASAYGEHVFALLPTGGGKSICFQVPALCHKGLCIVVTPLLALMKDQVESLIQKEIPATYLSSELNNFEIEKILDDCTNRKYKFLYVSPERLENDNFIARIRYLNISFVAIDEAHCISQWGHDFRPAYRAIPNFLKELRDPVVMAVTATATPQVVADIATLVFNNDCKIIQKSFARKNIAYNALFSTQKENDLVDRIVHMKGAGIVYCNSRKKTEDLSALLNEKNIKALPYHAGLDLHKKDLAFQKWKNNDVQVIVATNAFGMGIDKPDVRFVFHFDIPSQPEAYFQEVGRAGRDEQPALGLALWNDSDFVQLKKSIAMRYPPKEDIATVYQTLANIHRIAIGSGMNELFALNLDQIAERSQLHANTISASLLLLERAGYISILARGLHRSRVRVIASKEELRNFVDQHPKHEDFLRSLFRLYGSIWDFAVPISEYQLSVLNERSKNEVLTSLNDLHKLQILEYLPASSTSQYSYVKQRVATNEIFIPETMYEERRDIDLAKLNSMQHLLSEDHCREQYILRYFGEDTAACGKCDHCQRERALPTTKEILQACLTGKTLDELYAWPISFNKEKTIELVQEALAEGWIIPKEGKYFTAK
ncbi:MAG: RecQ family ATP-dependent DNA helicase [Flavobacteriales bacterium]|nr:RecQ family ATP-dependent DNA helicase [Flavobacteriales bacterium]